MSKECERTVKTGDEVAADRLYKKRQTGDQAFANPGSPSWQFDWTNLNAVRHGRLPLAENGAVAPRIRKAKEAKSRVGVEWPGKQGACPIRVQFSCLHVSIRNQFELADSYL
jgi:hypothetical protein